jgi:hypothetical protein
MSSSIEEQFDPPDWANKDEVIRAARHYINYWKIEARQRNAQWLQALEDMKAVKEQLRTSNEQLLQIRLDATKDPVLISVIKDSIQNPRKPNEPKAKA